MERESLFQEVLDVSAMSDSCSKGRCPFLKSATQLVYSIVLCGELVNKIESQGVGTDGCDCVSDFEVTKAGKESMGG